MGIDQEMSKGKDSKHNNPPNVIAKLMGLDTLPKGEPNLSVVRNRREDYSQHMYGHLGSPFKPWQLEDRFMDKAMLNEVHHYPSTEHIAYNIRDKLPERRRWNNDVDEENMGLIRRKFMEAKHLSTDERLRQSKQFGDALEVLSSNSDLLIRFLDSQNLYEVPSTPMDQRESITLIKPLKMVDNDKSSGKGKKSDRLIKKPANAGYSPECRKVEEFPVQSTRIVVLKPSPGRTHDLKALISPSPTTASPQSFYQEPQNDVVESIKVAKEIRRQIQELRSYQKDKTLYSSVFSNGYSSDESSCNKSYHEYPAGKLSDLEAMSLSPLPRHSWDCANVWRSPYSTKSLGRASCSPESSVCIEAKKRLSERWNMITSNDKGHQEQRRARRSSTLGEMLSLSLVKKSVTSEVESTNEDQEPSKAVSCSNSFNEEMGIVDCPKNVPGLNSDPISSTVYETQLNAEVCDHDAGKAHGSEALAKSKSTRSSSFKGKVASFFFSRNKKSTKKKSSPSQSIDEPQSSAPLVSDMSQSFNSGGFEEYSLAALCESSDKTSTDSVSNGQQQDMITIEPGSTVWKSVVPEISSEKRDQPSPISVLESSFENYNTTHESLDCMKGGHMGSREQLKSNLINKSPPIESVARTLSWDGSSAEIENPYPIKPLGVSSLDTNTEEHEWLILVQKLLSAAGLDDQQQYDPFHSRWYSLESPLDPSLRATYANMSDKDTLPLNEAKRRKIRSNQKLVFDCVNDALLEVVGCGSENYFKDVYSGSHKRALVQEGESPYLVDHIMAQMKELIASGRREGCGDNHSLVVENLVRKEVVEIGWAEQIKLEIDILGREIEGMLIEELVENAVVDFTGRA